MATSTYVTSSMYVMLSGYMWKARGAQGRKKAVLKSGYSSTSQAAKDGKAAAHLILTEEALEEPERFPLGACTTLMKI